MFSREFSFCFFISYAYIFTCIGRHLKESFPRVTSRGLKWENKMYKLKRSIGTTCAVCMALELRQLVKGIRLVLSNEKVAIL